jgi:hypothetical protein
MINSLGLSLPHYKLRGVASTHCTLLRGLNATENFHFYSRRANCGTLRGPSVMAIS